MSCENKYEKERLLTEVLGAPSREGKELRYFCPVCNHHNKNLSVDPVKGKFRCWTCEPKFGGNASYLVRRFGGQEASRRWAALSGIPLSEFDEVAFDEVLQPPLRLENPPDLYPVFDGDPRAWEYLEARGVTKMAAERYRICLGDGRYSGRVVFPSFNLAGDMNFFVARSYVGHRIPYLSPPSNSDLIFNELFVDWDKPLVIVEGLFDAIKVSMAGMQPLPLLGSQMKPGGRLMGKLSVDGLHVTIALDSDARRKQRKIVRDLLLWGVGVSTVRIEEGDIGDMTVESFREIYASRRRVADEIDLVVEEERYGL